jgi:hypothetical protein
MGARGQGRRLLLSTHYPKRVFRLQAKDRQEGTSTCTSLGIQSGVALFVDFDADLDDDASEKEG